MKISTISRAVLCALAVAGLVSCGSDSGGGGGSSSVDQGGVVAGKIAGFGSIIMEDGVEYETEGLSNCEVDDLSAAGVCEDSLSTGMRVTMHVNANDVVTSLKYDDEMEGVTSNVTGTNGDYNFEVFGVTVTTTNPDTQWDDFSTNPPTAIELDGVNVEISGEWQGNILVASYVEKQGGSDTSYEVKGTVGVITGTDFPLTLRNGDTINVDASAVSQLPVEGDFVEVKGGYNSGTSTFLATEIEVDDKDDFDSDSEVEITGILTVNSNSSTGYSIGNTDVDISSAASCNGLSGFRVEAEGTFNLNSGVLVVEECEDEDEDMEVKCQVNTATVADDTKPKVGSVECDFPGTTGGPLTIMFNDSPELAMFSGDSTASTFDLTNINPGDCVEIKFSKNANGDFIAGLIAYEGSGGCSSYKLEAVVDSFSDGNDITALGITYTANPTVYDPVGSNATLNTGDKVKIIDNDFDGNADSIAVD